MMGPELYSFCKMLSHPELLHKSVFMFSIISFVIFNLFFLCYWLMSWSFWKANTQVFQSYKDYFDAYSSHLHNFIFI